MIFKLMYLIDLDVLNLMVCLTLHINCMHYHIYRLVFRIRMVKIIKVKIPLGSCKLYANRNIP